ncbi:hypothetical protein [Methanobacterium sp.]|uniref:hypothetical protein n=1 Tax=Methanobacterium sp. TaxID=2164 RepID=UPI003C759F58
MKRITISVDSEVDLKFRKKASQKYQFEKGWYSSALAEAMAFWSEDEQLKSTIEPNNYVLKEYINPELWKNLNNHLNLDDENLFENYHNIVEKFNQDKDRKITIERENGIIVIKLDNKNDSDIKSNLENYIFLYQLLDIIIPALEQTSKEKFEIVGMDKLPKIYIKKVEK